MESIQPGEYNLSQKVQPEGYGLNTQTQVIEVLKSITKDKASIDSDTHEVSLLEMDDVVFSNYRGKVILNKVSSETQEPLAGVVFDLYKGNELIKKGLVTDANGRVDYEFLAPGAYAFVETQSDGIHMIDPQRREFTIDDQNEGAYDAVEIGVSNYYANIFFRNTDPNNTMNYEDGRFSLLEKVNDEWLIVDDYRDFTSSMMRDGTAVFTLSGLKVRKYQLRQIKAPTSTLLNTRPYEFEVTEVNIQTRARSGINMEMNPFINYQAKLSVDVLDPYGTYDDTITLTLIDAQGRKVSEMTYDESIYTVENLSPGTYRVVLSDVKDAIIVDKELEVIVPDSADEDLNLEVNATARVTYAKVNVTLHDGLSK